jgi:hypothetical protein
MSTTNLWRLVTLLLLTLAVQGASAQNALEPRRLTRLEIIDRQGSSYAWIQLEGVTQYSCPGGTGTYGYLVGGNDRHERALMALLIAAYTSGRKIIVTPVLHEGYTDCRVDSIRLVE